MAIYSCGVPIGLALNSLTTEMIRGLAWRQTFAVVGLIWMGFGLAIIAFVREPLRSNYSFVSKETYNQPKRGYLKTTY